MKSKKYNKKNKDAKVEETRVKYKTRKLGEIYNNITFSSLEEQENEMRTYSAGLTKRERMEYLYDLICRLNREEIEKVMDKNIIIDKIC